MPAIPAIGAGGGWNIGGVGGLGSSGTASGTGATGKGGFGAMLENQLNALDKSQQGASAASRSLADGTASDPETAVMAVEKAQLSMQLASQLRTKGLEAFTDVFHTQI